jgi:predicted enzyme related to lactoylglutathione lyase
MIKRIWDITVTVTDIRKAADFYEKVLGLQKKYEFKDYAGFDCGGIEIGLKTWGELEKPRQGEPCINFLVDNIDTSYQALTEKGVAFSGKPSDTHWGSRIAVFNDPDGNSLQISEVDWSKYLSASAPK